MGFAASFVDSGNDHIQVKEYDLKEYHLTHPEKTDESGLLTFIVQQMADGFRIFLEEAQFISGNALFITVVLKGAFTLLQSMKVFS